MDGISVRETLDRLIAARGVSYSGLSEMLGKNPAYIQQFIKRGTPRRLDERDRRLLAQFFGVAETTLGAPGGEDGGSADRSEAAGRRGRGGSRLRRIPRLAIGASAGAGALTEDERPMAEIAFDEDWLRQLGAGSAPVTMIRVEGDSMAPALSDGDDILVAMRDGGPMRPRDGIYVLRMDDALIVKRLAFRPDGRLSVTSDNPLYPSYPDLDPDSVQIVGRVIWAGRRM